MRLEAIKRHELAAVYNSALNHLVTVYSYGNLENTLSALEDALLSMPCPYCGERGLRHHLDCDRADFNEEQLWEKVMSL